MGVSLLLLAAFFHACWNAILKSASNKLFFLTLLNIFSCSLAAVFLIVVEPISLRCLPYLLASLAFHICYVFLLILSYRFGDFSQVYPIARGTGPFIVALASYPIFGEALTHEQYAGIFFVTSGMFVMALSQVGGKHSTKAMVFALLTGVLIACYTMIDGHGSRLSGSPFAYTAYLIIGETVPLVTSATLRHFGNQSELIKKYFLRAALSGVMAFSAYGIVLWTMTFMPIAYVAAFRETSVLIAALISFFVLKEPVGRGRFYSSLLIFLGVVLLNIHR